MTQQEIAEITAEIISKVKAVVEVQRSVDVAAFLAADDGARSIIASSASGIEKAQLLSDLYPAVQLKIIYAALASPFARQIIQAAAYGRIDADDINEIAMIIDAIADHYDPISGWEKAKEFMADQGITRSDFMKNFKENIALVRMFYR